MAGRIPEQDIAAIRERTRIEEIVGEYVALKPAGADSLKGLSPFKDEKTPSFHVRPQHGYFHCFSTGEGGDVFAFLMKMEHIGFVEAVEQLADRIGYRISYEGGGQVVQRDRGTRSRLAQANAAAQKFYAERLAQDPEAETARTFLTDRGFDMAQAQHFGCGYAPAGWDTMSKHLMRQGFEPKELEAAGLSKTSSRGTLIDRFHRRLLWPIRNLAGEVIGFGARKLFEDDTLGKYMNTPETMLYKKSQVLFGLDLAKREIASQRRAVVVEGYTDVMAMHAAGVTTAVAACGTAFGEDHLSTLRRLMLDDNYFRGEIIYTFDGDEAGKKAALRAFSGDQQFSGRTFVAVAPPGLDPCDLRQTKGDVAVRDLVSARVPMFEFAIRSMLEDYDLDHAEGRVEALRRTVPVVADIRDSSLRDEYARQLAGWVGWDDPATVVRRVREESRKKGRARSAGAGPGPRRRGPGGPGGGARPGWDAAERGGVGRGRGGYDDDEVGGGDAPRTPEVPKGVPIPAPGDPVLWPQREAVKAALQYPGLAGPLFDSLPDECYTHPAYAAIAEALSRAGGCAAGKSGVNWVAEVSQGLEDEGLRRLVGVLAVETLRVSEEALPRYISGVLARLQEVWVSGQIADLKSKVQRMSPAEDPEGYSALFGDLVALEEYRRGLLEQAVGATPDIA
ncbi:DNA primase [Dietzia cinnamea]|uniref:DNA primase n=9 Tax=Dietzia TaxID=37914 RepID=A0ABV3YKN7_9ACTN|nr:MULTISPECIES: DNA primase [Dietzia]KZO57939.1 DNA primase [Dietzia maris]MCT2057942.1 DNA primase [Dietzia cinnamea]MCT2236727.1 DNA primase [Dietzia cinnamea]MCT2300978.1 DNA primase [Dietzia cinnamea]